MYLISGYSQIRIRIKMMSWIRSRINLQMTNQNVRYMDYEPIWVLFQGFEHLFGTRIRIQFSDPNPVFGSESKWKIGPGSADSQLWLVPYPFHWIPVYGILFFSLDSQQSNDKMIPRADGLSVTDTSFRKGLAPDSDFFINTVPDYLFIVEAFLIYT